MDAYRTIRNIGDPPIFMKLSAFATRLGLSPDMIESEASAGRIPVEVTRIGPRGTRHVRTEQAMQYLQRAAGGVRS